MMCLSEKTIGEGRCLRQLVQDFQSDEEGATAIEYCLIVSLIFLAVMAGVNAVATSNSENYSVITSTLEST